MQKVLTAAEMREVDRLTTERYGIPSIILMENAAHAVARVITEKLGGSVKGKSILILCGKGNNGGDGFALARILWNQGANVTVCMMFPDDEVSGDAAENLRLLRRLHENRSEPFKPTICFAEVGTHRSFFEGLDPFLGPDVVVDAVFGTGLTRPLDGELALLAKQYKSLLTDEDRPLFVSIDIPSGLDSDSPEPIGESFAADVTVSLTGTKPANVLPPAFRLNGELFLANIGSPPELIDEQPSQLYLAEREDAEQWLRRAEFSADSYKNKRGHALIVAGSADYAGAAVLAGNAAMRSGAGLVTLACPSDAKAEIAARLVPEVILSTIDSSEFASHLERADAVAVGCGLDVNDPAVLRIVRGLIEDRKKPTIVDAGALSVFSSVAGGYVQPPATAGGSDLILTPHEGEFLRLIAGPQAASLQVSDPLKDRVTAVGEFAVRNNCILVLKGERVLIGSPDGHVVVNPTGNSGLGKAGNGDTLAGILAGFVAQAARMKIDIFETVVAAVYIAGMAGDIAEKNFGKRVMTASDVRECLVEVFAEFK
ncbi:MAG: NAD(P)H-hydrate dehydratase [Acidobacteria bacterium]|nr:NAD(P)H-hydrate dehydratase [Acidobacteriota bacterium]